MSYQLYRRKNAEANLRAVASGELDLAIRDCRDDTLEPDDAVHSVRKRCKRLRGLYRIVETHFPAFKPEDVAVKKIARSLASTRDADVALATFDNLSERFQPILKAAAVQPIRRWLADDVGHDDADARDQLLEDTAAALEVIRDRAARFSLTKTGFSVVHAGMTATLNRAEAARQRAMDTPSLEALHDWRKQVKYHWYHLNLIEPAWPDMIAPTMITAEDLQDLLGDDHDLALLRDTLTKARINADPAAVHVIISLIDWRRAALLRKIARLSDRLFAEGADNFMKRVKAYSRIWRDKGPKRNLSRALTHIEDQIVSGS